MLFYERILFLTSIKSKLFFDHLEQQKSARIEGTEITFFFEKQKEQENCLIAAHLQESVYKVECANNISNCAVYY